MHIAVLAPAMACLGTHAEALYLFLCPTHPLCSSLQHGSLQRSFRGPKPVPHLMPDVSCWPLPAPQQLIKTYCGLIICAASHA